MEKTTCWTFTWGLACWALVCAAAGCDTTGSGSGDSAANGDHGNFAGGSKKLLLRAAPPGLCDGNGSLKECEDGNECADETAGAGDGNARGSSQGGGGSGGSSSGLGPTSTQYAPPTAGAAGYNPAPESWDPMPPSGGYGGAAGGAPTALDAGAPTDGGGSTVVLPPPDGGACEPGPDGGLPDDCGDAGEEDDCQPGPDGGLPDDCGDAGDIGVSLSALVEDDVPKCDTLVKSKPYTLYMSADDSNSMASPVVARRMIRGGYPVDARLVRPHEFLNYYDFSFEPAPAGELSVVAQLSSCPQDGQLSFQVALQSEARSNADRKPLNITFVLDTSGSMDDSSMFGEPVPIELERAAVRAIAGQLQEGDRVSMVTWSTTQQDILSGHYVSGPDDPAVLSAADSLMPGGGTDLAAGLARGYALAREHYSATRINRVILISDGQANVGVTDEELIGQWADDEEGEEGIYLAGIGVGDGYDDTLMDVVTDKGRGAYVYIDSVAEATKMLGKRFLQVVDLAARAVRLEVTLPWYLAIEKFYGEVVSTDPEKVRPQHLAPNDAMLFFQVLEACDPALLHGDDRIQIRATWETPFTREKKQYVLDALFNDLAGDDADLTKAAAIAGYAEALILADQQPQNREKILQKALDNVLAAKDSDRDPDLVEVAELIRLYLNQRSATDDAVGYGEY